MNAGSKSIAEEARDPDIDRLWADEGERRLDAYLRGGAKARDANDVLAKHLKP
jgi:putative addiction module component